MHGKTWLITGCSSGFGRALAALLLKRGERVAATARKPETLDALVTAYGANALALKLDTTKAEDIENAVAAARDRFGPIDVLVNNAGYAHMGTIEETSIEATKVMFETNLFGSLAMMQAVLPEMRQRRSGQIVNISSIAGTIGFPALGGYCATKFGLVALSESLAIEVRSLGIKVTVAELGPFATGFNSAIQFDRPPAPDYDLAALSVEAGTSVWGAGDDPSVGAAALLAALDHPSPPLHLLLGQHALNTFAMYDKARREERDRWLGVSQLDVTRTPRSGGV